MSTTPRTDALTIAINEVLLLNNATGVSATEIAAVVRAHYAKLERENARQAEEIAKLTDENVEANGLLDMQMKEMARLRFALATIADGG